ncbi:MAG: hypothetical protein C0615_00440 [Desulfuromonas sp.]|nr:MAG: hypothetical protein C0615_00440 [Desulfuromonas sp.]
MADIPDKQQPVDFMEAGSIEEQVRFLALFPEENPYPVLRVDEYGVLLYANRSAARLSEQWGCAAGEMSPDFILREVQTALEENKKRELETRCNGRDFSFTMVPIVDRGYVNFYGRDVTDRKQTEFALRHKETLFKRAQEIAHLGSWELNLVNNTLTWSDEVYRIFGLRPQQFTADYETFLEIVHPDDRQSVNEAYTRSLQEGEDGYEIEHRIVRRDNGEIRYVHEKCEHFRNRKREVVRSIGMVHDITGHKTKEERIRRLNAELEERALELADANSELEAFNYTVAHDLRKPLTVISGYAQMLADQCRDDRDEFCRFLSEIVAGTRDMSDLIEALLDFSRLAHVEIDRKSVDLSRLVRVVAAELELADPERMIEVRFDDGMRVDADEDLLRVVVMNLVGNAWKYAGGGEGAVVEVGMTRIDDIDTFHVRDNGPGFDFAAAEDLFEPFKRAKGAGEKEGFGIGLATVDRIVRRHGGRVWAESEPGKGAAFFFTLGG